MDQTGCKLVVPNTFIACGEGGQYCSELCQTRSEGKRLVSPSEAMRRLLGQLLPGEDDKKRDDLLEERRNILAAVGEEASARLRGRAEDDARYERARKARAAKVEQEEGTAS